MPSDKSLPVYVALQTLVPELVESENERMYARVTGRYTRFEKYYLRALGETEANKVLKQCEEEELWIKNLLEKQKESLHIQETCKENPNSFTNEDEKIREEMIRYFTEMKKGGSVALPYDDCITYLERRNEQKPAEWSEEDRRIIDRACVTLRAYANGELPDILPSEIFEYADKLQSLRPQPKEEWGEEDEENLEKVIWYIEKGCKLIFQKPDKLISWLKSLRPQLKEEGCNYITPNKKFFQWIYDRLVNVHNEDPNVDYMMSFKERINNLSFEDKHHWKPSEEQMKAFKDYIEDFQAKAEAAVGGWNNFDVMIELYEQLKKL